MASSRPEVYRREAEQQAAGSSIYRFPDKPFPHSILLVFKEYSYKKGFGESQYAVGANGTSGLLSALADSTGRRSSGIGVRNERTVELPFPKQLQDSTNITLNGISRDPLVEKATEYLNDVAMGGSGTLGDLPKNIQAAGAALAGLASGGGDSGGFTSAIGDVAKSIGATSNKDAALIARYLLQQASPLLGDIGASINLAAGQTLNPKETLVFEGVQLRSHTFTWELYPDNVRDSDQINNIINIMKRSVLPRTVSFEVGSFNFERAFLKFPFVVYTYLIGVDGGSFPKFKPAMVTNMTVDYNPGGSVSILKGGKPNGVTLSISMQELAIETAEDYGEERLAANEGIVSDTEVAQTQTNAQPAGPGGNGGV